MVGAPAVAGHAMRFNSGCNARAAVSRKICGGGVGVEMTLGLFRLSTPPQALANPAVPLTHGISGHNFL